MDKKYVVGEVPTQTQEMVVGPDGKPISVVEALTRILNTVEEINKKV